MPGLRLAGILSHAGHAYHAHSDEELARHGHRGARPDGRRCQRGARRRHRHRRGERRRHAAGAALAAGRARAPSPNSGPAITPTSIARWWGSAPPRATTARSRCWPRWSARRRPIGSCSTAAARPSPPTAPAASPQRPATATSTARSRPRPARSPIRTCVVERLSEEHATVRVDPGAAPLRPGRSGARLAQPRLRRVESGRRGVARRRARGGERAADCGARPDPVARWLDRRDPT